MADSANKRTHLSESERNELYAGACYRFTKVSTWREYMHLAEQFHELGDYKEALQMYDKCIGAAASPAYREVTERLATTEQPTAADYREAAHILQLFPPDYRDCRELVRVYTVRANALAYEEAQALVTNSEATTEELGRGVEILREIKTFRNARDLLERYEKYYFERMYAEGMLLEENARVYIEYEEAAEVFEKIKAYSDAARHAASCRKRAAKLRPAAKRAATRGNDGEETVRVTGKSTLQVGRGGSVPETPSPQSSAGSRRRRKGGESTVAEVWRTVDKRRAVWFFVWVVMFVLSIYASIVLPNSQQEIFRNHPNEIRGITSILGIASGVMSVRSFFRMLTASMRQKLKEAALKALKKMAAPLVKAVQKLLLSIGLDLSRRGRAGGRDEKTFVFTREEKAPKPKGRLKNDLKWQDQTDNAARVRFIYIEYMIRRVREGYRMKRTMTPAEIGRDLGGDEWDKKLFSAYDKARYAGTGALDEITDGVVGELQLLNQKKNG